MIWIATEDGLNRYDGSKFTIYRHDANDPGSVLHNYVRCFLEDNDGHFIIGYFSGLQLYDYASDTFKEIPVILESGRRFNPHVTSLLQRKNGDILAAVSHYVLVITVQDNEVVALQNSKLVPSNRIQFLFEDRDENLWVGTEDKGLLCLDKNNQVKSYLTSKPVPQIDLSSICQNSKGEIFVSTLTTGIYKYNEEKDLFEPIPYAQNKNLPVKTLYVNQDDKLFIGTEGHGLKMYDADTNNIVESTFNVTTFDFSRAKVHSIMEDDQGNVWLGIFQKGVLLLPAQSNKFRYIGYKSVTHNSIGSNSVMSLYKDRAGIIWVGTDSDGLYGIDSSGKQVVHFESNHKGNGVPSTIMSVYEDSNEDLWVGSY